jgi:hypothetical protein
MLVGQRKNGEWWKTRTDTMYVFADQFDMGI